MIDIVYRRAPDHAHDRDDDRLRDMIGVELQGESYRKLVQLASVAEDVYAKGCEIGWLEKRGTREQPKRGRAKDSRFNQYDQGNGHFFVYQSKPLRPDDRKFIHLIESIFQDMGQASEKVKKLEGLKQ